MIGGGCSVHPECRWSGVLAGNNITDDLGGGWYKAMNGDEIATERQQ